MRVIANIYGVELTVCQAQRQALHIHVFVNPHNNVSIIILILKIGKWEFGKLRLLAKVMAMRYTQVAALELASPCSVLPPLRLRVAVIGTLV